MCEQDTTNCLVLEAYRLSELQLIGDEQAAAAADQRATNFFAACLAAATILATLYAAGQGGIGLLVSCALFALAGALAGYSIRPRQFYYPGTTFESFEADINGQKPYLDAIKELAAFNDENSTENKQKLLASSKLIWWSYRIAFAAVVALFLFQLAQVGSWMEAATTWIQSVCSQGDTQ